MDGVAPVIWLGHRHVDRAHHPRPCDVWPVRIAAGTFGPGQPRRDLLLSPDHAIFINVVLIPVKYLINSDAIDRVPADEVLLPRRTARARRADGGGFDRGVVPRCRRSPEL
jgi:hypothetical protein